MLQLIVDFLTDPVVLTLLGTAGAAVCDAVSAAMLGTHPLIARALKALADLIRTKAGRPPVSPLLLALCLLPLLSLSARAETITTVGGEQFARAADGKFYPSQCVRPDGRVATAAHSCPGGCVSGKWAPYCCSEGWPCPFGANAGPGCPCSPTAVAPQPLTAFPVYRPAAQQPSCPSCSGGNCPAPSRPRFFQR